MRMKNGYKAVNYSDVYKKIKQSKCFSLREWLLNGKVGVIKIGCFGEFLTWGVHKIKLSVRKKAGYRTINSKISVILK